MQACTVHHEIFQSGNSHLPPGNGPFKWRSRDGKLAMKAIVDALQ